MTVPPEWLSSWCRQHLGAAPSSVLHASSHMSEVFGLRLTDGRSVVVKARPDQSGRAATCVEVQRTLTLSGFPAAAPITGVTIHGGRAIHAEQWRPGGDLLRGDDPATARLFATLLARLVDLAADIEVGGTAPGAVEPPLPNPEWTRWDHDAPGVWPPIDYLDTLDAVSPPEVPAAEPVTPPVAGPKSAPPLAGVAEPAAPVVPSFVTDAARRVRERLAVIYLPRVLGHADWESQNLRWHGETPWAVHDWDSLAWLPEAAIAGAAAGAFASAEVPTLTPIASSEAFLEAYQEARRPFSAEEIEVAWAAGLWLGLHNARAEALRGAPPTALTAVAEQAPERLRLAGT